MIASLLCRPLVLEFRGTQITLRRPTVAHLVAAIDATERGVYMPAWYVWNHVMDGDAQAFESLDAVMQLDAPGVILLGREIEGLYLEGLDSPGLRAKS